MKGDEILGDDRIGSARGPSFLQRRALKGLLKQARKHPDEPLTPADWESYWTYVAQPSSRAFKRVLRTLPSTPRCGYCGAPFAGVGARLVRPFGYRPSRKNPNICSTCVELAPPGGMTLEIGVLFADLRGFTSDSESRTPADVSIRLRRFYAHAEKVFFPEALIDKLIGDEVMALYVPTFMMPAASIDDDTRRHVAHVMLEHAHELLERVGYGTAGVPDFEVGIGLDFGEAFIGNIGDTAVHDFTAVGDVVNTASRLQGHAATGEVVLSARLARFLPASVGVPEQVVLKGKQQPCDVRRVQWYSRSVSPRTEPG
ncbi:MAG: adenylate/guanylate cyclase domain-containing protein [Ilumatobacteraceae bacterium]